MEPRPKFVVKPERSRRLEGARGVEGEAAIAVNVPATTVYSGLKKGVLAARLGEL